MAFDYDHKPLPREVQSISGIYRLQEERLLDSRYGRILYLTGFGVVDNACCGVGGCSYALVPGVVHSYRYAQNAMGHEVSSIEAVADQESRRDIAGLIKRRDKVQQVLFQDPS